MAEPNQILPEFDEVVAELVKTVFQVFGIPSALVLALIGAAFFISGWLDALRGAAWLGRRARATVSGAADTAQNLGALGFVVAAGILGLVLAAQALCVGMSAIAGNYFSIAFDPSTGVARAKAIEKAVEDGGILGAMPWNLPGVYRSDVFVQLNVLLALGAVILAYIWARRNKGAQIPAGFILGFPFSMSFWIHTFISALLLVFYLFDKSSETRSDLMFNAGYAAFCGAYYAVCQCATGGATLAVAAFRGARISSPRSSAGYR